MMNVAQGHLFGTIFEAILYGIYFTLFVICMFVFDNKKPATNLVVKYTVIAMFLVSTAHIGGTIASLQAGFFTVRPETPEKYFNSKAVPLNLVNKSFYGLNMVLGDALMIYRLWIIYLRNWYIIVLPILLTAATGTLIAVTIWEFSMLVPGQTAFASKVKAIAPALFAVPLVTNLVITGLIIWRIKQAHNSRHFVANHKLDAIYRRLIRNTIESCAIYPFVLLVTLILYCRNDNGQDVLTGSMAQVVSIVPTLMWLQQRLGQSALGNMGEETPPPPVSEKTIEFMPNSNLRSTNLDTIGSGHSTDIEATTSSNKEGNLVPTPTSVVHAQ